MDSNITIRINGMEFGYSDLPVLSDINIDIDGPQFVSIVGPNGVGKSTLIHCINKILEPTGGTVFLNEKNVDDFNLKEMAKVIGYVPHKASETFPLTVIDAVLLGRNPHSGWKTTQEDLRIVYDTLRKLEIEDLSMRRFNELSAGQRQRVMLARGLVQNPQAILLDEPTSNLDIKHQLRISHLLYDLSRDENLLVIVVSHDLNLAAKYSDNIILMSEGAVYAVGSPKDVLTPENIKRVYGVDSHVIDDNGTPHIILQDDLVTSAAPHGATCTGSSPSKQFSEGDEVERGVA